MLVTDMNARERKQFADKAESLADAAKKLAAALLAEDDIEALIYLALTGVAGGFINDLVEIFTKAETGVRIPDSPAPLGLTPTKYTNNPLNNRGEAKK